eukprot:Hpha_TRINITY_DN15423_c6_g1::TRINITY_DN15423_c6_g1_i1::g.174656::m.174656
MAWFLPCMAVSRVTPICEAWLRTKLGPVLGQGGCSATAFLPAAPIPLTRIHALAGVMHGRFGVARCIKRDAVVVQDEAGSWGYLQWRPRCVMLVGAAGLKDAVLPALRAMLPDCEETGADKMLRPLVELPPPLQSLIGGKVEDAWYAVSGGSLPDETSPFPDVRTLH